MAEKVERKERKPELRFKGFDGEWEEEKFSSVFSYLQNNTLSRAELTSDTGFAKNIHYGDILTKFEEVLDVENIDLPFTSNKDVVAKFSSSFLRDKDVVIADTAEDETVGKCCELKGVRDDIVLSGLHTIPCRPNQTFSSEYLGYYLNSPAYHSQLLPLMQGTKVTSISKNALGDTEILYPATSDEQGKISCVFSSLTLLITNQQHKYDQLQNLKKAMLEKMFPREGADVPEIRFKGFEGAWNRELLNVYLTVSNEKNETETYTKEDVLSVSGEVGIVNQIKFQGRSFAGVSVSNYGVVHTGDIVYTKSPLSSNPFGIIKTNLGCTGIVSTLYAIYRPTEKVYPEFVQHYFEQNERLNNYLRPLVNKGAKNDMKVPNDRVLTGRVSIPGYAEQKRISEFFSSIDVLLNKSAIIIGKLQSFKSALLEKMFVSEAAA